MKSRLLVTAMVCLVLGAIANVAVSWTIVLQHGAKEKILYEMQFWQRSERSLTDSELRWFRSKEQQATVQALLGLPSTSHGWNRGKLVASEHHSATWNETLYVQHYQRTGGQLTLDPRTGRYMVPVASADSGDASLGRIQCGWPLCSMSLTLLEFPMPFPPTPPKRSARPSAWDEGWTLPAKWGSPGRGTNYVVPLVPLWPGFAINTLLYALVLCELLAGPAQIRRAIRCRQLRCVRCNYDLRGQIADAAGQRTCPECGMLSKSSSRSARAPGCDPDVTRTCPGRDRDVTGDMTGDMPGT
jgi:hypothetical protein